MILGHTTSIDRKEFLRLLVSFCFFSFTALSKEAPSWITWVPPQFHEQVQELLDHPTFVRCPKPQAIPISEEFFELLLKDWDLASRLAKELGIKGYEIQKREEGWRVLLSRQTFVEVTPLLHEKGRSLFLARGEHHGTMIRNLILRSVFWVEYNGYGEEGDVGATRQVVVPTLTAYIKIDQSFLALLAKVSLPFIGGKIDKKLSSILQDIEKASQKIHEDPLVAREAIQRSFNFTPAEKQVLRKYL